MVVATAVLCAAYFATLKPKFRSTRFYATREQVHKAEGYPEQQYADMDLYFDVEVLGRQACLYYYYNEDGKFDAAMYCIFYSAGTDCLLDYDKVKAELSDIYGKPTIGHDEGAFSYKPIGWESKNVRIGLMASSDTLLGYSISIYYHFGPYEDE